MRSPWPLALALASLAVSPAHAQESLEVPGHHPAVVVPASATPAGPRPVVVALHGNFDRPEWMCGAWAPIVQGRAFLLCLRGQPRTDRPELDRWQYGPTSQVRRELTAARAALVERYGARVAPGPDLFVGFSQGAHRVSRMAVETPSELPRIQLVEGGASIWRGAPRYGRDSGARVAMVCAVNWCEQRGRRARRSLRRAGVEVRLERRPGAHHDLAVMGPAIRDTFEWLIAGDPRFAAP